MQPQPCAVCATPATAGPDPDRPLCARCAAIARDIANQQAAVMVTALRTLKAEHEKQEVA